MTCHIPLWWLAILVAFALIFAGIASVAAHEYLTLSVGEPDA